MHILVINPGSTSTKIAVYYDTQVVLQLNIPHSMEELAPYKEITDQYDFRKQVVTDVLQRNHIPFDFDAVIGRGGLAKPIEGGVYEVNQQMLDDTRHAVMKHACNLGCFIAYEMAEAIPGCQALIADPGTVDELSPLARISGSPLLPRISLWHALNQRAIARRYARETHRRYEDLNLIVCHMGGGISIAAHQHGRAVDANNALDGEGPFSPERAGSLPTSALIRLCFSGRFTEHELLQRVTTRAGVVAHLGTNDMIAIEHRINEGDEHAKLIVDAMIYQTAKSIAAESAVLCGKVDAILLTGGVAKWQYVVDELTRRLSFLAPVRCYPGEDEMEALAQNALAVLQGRLKAKPYNA